MLDLVLAFAAGLLSFASTCVLPLVPAYITYMGDRSITTTPESRLRQQVRVLSNAMLFIAGFTTAFVALGASAALIGADLRAVRPVLLQVAGVALVLLGVALLFSRRIPWLMSEKRFDVAHRLPRAPWASFVVGLAFAVGWTPCVGPILAAILLRAGSSGTAAQGAVLLAAYSLGLGVPFLVAAGLSGLLTRAMARIRGAYAALNGVAAVFLIAMGVLIFSNRLTLFNSYLPFINVTTPFDSAFSANNPTPAPASGPVRIGQPAPAFDLTDTDGHRVRLADLKGRPILINFWATWCGPCRDELPLMSAAYQAHRAEGLTVIAVNFGESKDIVLKFWKTMNLQLSPFLDPAGTASDAYGVALGTGKTGLPVSVFIDRNGRVASYQQSLSQDFLDAELKKIL